MSAKHPTRLPAFAGFLSPCLLEPATALATVMAERDAPQRSARLMGRPMAAASILIQANVATSAELALSADQAPDCLDTKRARIPTI